MRISKEIAKPILDTLWKNSVECTVIDAAYIQHGVLGKDIEEAYSCGNIRFRSFQIISINMVNYYATIVTA